MYPSLGTPNLEQSCFRLQTPPLYKFLRTPLLRAYFKDETTRRTCELNPGNLDRDLYKTAFQGIHTFISK